MGDKGRRRVWGGRRHRDSKRMATRLSSTMRYGISMGDREPCPCESVAPSTSPGPVSDAEVLIRFVEKSDLVVADDLGRNFLAATAVSKNDLHGKGGQRSFSVVREGYTEAEELKRRAVARTREDQWRDNPVLARTEARRLREIVDLAMRREICVNSDPTYEKNDALGPLPSHASVVRADPPLDDKMREQWLRLRTAVGECFDDIRHCDGTPVAPKE